MEPGEEHTIFQERGGNDEQGQSRRKIRHAYKEVDKFIGKLFKHFGKELDKQFGN